MHVGGGSAAGAAAAAGAAIASGAAGLISFGLAGGLDPTLPPGALVVPRTVLTDGRRFLADPALRARLGDGVDGALLGADAVAATAAAKGRLWLATGAVAVDLESAAVARAATAAGLPFAVLRAICDPARRDLPPAALAALDHAGLIGLGRVIGSVLSAPWQVPGLLRLAADAAAARRALVRRVAALR